MLSLYQSAFKLIPDIYLIFDTNFNVIDCNEAYSTLTDVLEEHPIGKNILYIYKKNTYPDDFEKLIVFFQESKTISKPHDIEIRMQSVSLENKFKNKLKIFKIIHYPLHIENKLEKYFIQSIIDITKNVLTQTIKKQQDVLTEKLILHTGEMEEEINQYVKKLKEKNRKLTLEDKKARKLRNVNKRLIELSNFKNSFIANISHELRTPLHGILGFGKLLEQERVGSLNAKQKEYIDYIINSSGHLNLLINDLLDFTKIEAGKMDFNPAIINIADLIDDIKNFFKEAMAKKNLDFTIDYDPMLISIYHDYHRLTQIIYNYISNAIKFTPEHGKVSLIITAMPNKQFRLIVKDTGIGISENNLYKLFMEFQQLDDSMTKTYQGAGLGLAIVKRIVTLLGGEVGVESEIGKGSAFYATLPRNHKLLTRTNTKFK